MTIVTSQRRALPPFQGIYYYYYYYNYYYYTKIQEITPLNVQLRRHSTSLAGQKQVESLAENLVADLHDVRARVADQSKA